MTADLLATWRTEWRGLRDEPEALSLFAFRVLVWWLEQRGFFEQPPQNIYTLRAMSQSPPELTTLLRTRDSRQADTFARHVENRLASISDDGIAKLAFALDAELGPILSRHLLSRDRARLQVVAHAVNAANRVLTGELDLVRRIVLVRAPHRYWERDKNVVPEFPLPPQGLATLFNHLLPLSTRMNRVDYSTIGGGGARKITVTLWPVPAPGIDSLAMSTREVPGEPSVRTFRFRNWNELPEDVRAQHASLADRIAGHINSAADSVETIHIVAAPELMLAPESQQKIKSAVEGRRNASWIVFPGSYHIERGLDVINMAVMRVGGILDWRDLTIDRSLGAISAVKKIPFVFERAGQQYVEEITRSKSAVHLLDGDMGRIAVMICRDFLEPDLRDEIVKMGVDHLFVLSMSPDSGTKFAVAMNVASNERTGTFMVNAFTERSAGSTRAAGYRKPLKRATVKWKRPTAPEGCCTILLTERS